MANTNEEATCRVFHRLRIECAPGTLRVYGPTNQLDVYVEDLSQEHTVDSTVEERQAMLLAIFEKVRNQ